MIVYNSYFVSYNLSYKYKIIMCILIHLEMNTKVFNRIPKMQNGNKM